MSSDNKLCGPEFSFASQSNNSFVQHNYSHLFSRATGYLNFHECTVATSTNATDIGYASRPIASHYDDRTL